MEKLITRFSGVLGIVAALTLALNVLTPTNWHWLTEDQIDLLFAVLFIGTSLGAVLYGCWKSSRRT